MKHAQLELLVLLRSHGRSAIAVEGACSTEVGWAHGLTGWSAVHMDEAYLTGVDCTFGLTTRSAAAVDCSLGDFNSSVGLYMYVENSDCDSDASFVIPKSHTRQSVEALVLIMLLMVSQNLTLQLIADALHHLDPTSY